MDRTAEAKHAIRGEKIQARKVTVIPVDLGKRYKCYKCGIKFYDLGKPQPLCPSCGANQHDAVIKAARKRRGKHRSSYAAKTEPITVAPEETEDLHEVVGELDAEYALDVDDIVLEEHHDAEDKESLREEEVMAKATVDKKAVTKKTAAKATKKKAAGAKVAKPKAKAAKPKAAAAKATKKKAAVAKAAKPKAKAENPKAAAKVVKKKAK